MTEAVRLLWEGRPARREPLLEGRRPGRRGGGPRRARRGPGDHRPARAGFALLYQEWSRPTGRPHVTGLIALAHLLLGEWQDIARLLTGPSAAPCPHALVVRAIATARASGDEDERPRLEDAARPDAPGLLPAPGRVIPLGRAGVPMT